MNTWTRSLTAIVLAAGFSLAAIAPASADQAAATRNQIIGGLALIAGIATAVNVSNKSAAAQREQQWYDDRSYSTNDDGRSYRHDTYNGNASNAGASYDPGYQHQDGGQRRWAQRGWQR